MNNERTENTEPTVKRADALQAGDHVIEEFDGADRPAKVLVAHPYRNGDGTPMVSLMLDTLDGLRPLTMEYRADRMVELADEQDLAAFREAGRREALAKALRQLADDIVRLELPIPAYRLHVTGCLGSRAGVDRWAKHLGVEIEAGGTAGNIPVAGKELRVDGGLVLDLGMQGPIDPEPQPESCPCLDQPEPVETEQEWLFTFGVGQQFDGRFVRIVGTEESARARMNRVFGHAWCAQYDWAKFDADGLPARLAELPEAEWPPHADQEQADEPAKPCIACKHTDDHWHDLGCEHLNGYGQRCGCTHAPTGE